MEAIIDLCAHNSTGTIGSDVTPFVLGFVSVVVSREEKKSTNTASIGIIVAICVGGLLILVVIIAVIVFAKKRKNNKNFEATNKAFQKFDDVS